MEAAEAGEPARRRPSTGLAPPDAAEKLLQQRGHVRAYLLASGIPQVPQVAFQVDEGHGGPLAGGGGGPRALTVYQNRRWDLDFLTLRELLGNGSLGELTVFESRFERFRPDPGPPAADGGTLHAPAW